MIRRLVLAVALAFVVVVPAQAADPQKFGDEAKATAFCKAGNVVWFNPDSKIYFPPGSQFYGKTKHGGYTCISTSWSMPMPNAAPTRARRVWMARTLRTRRPPRSRRRHPRP